MDRLTRARSDYDAAPEEVALAQAIMTSRRVWLLLDHRDYESGTVAAVCPTREAAIAEAIRQQQFLYGADHRLRVVLDEAEEWRAYSGGVELWVTPFAVSLPKSPTGASAPRPEPETGDDAPDPRGEFIELGD